MNLEEKVDKKERLEGMVYYPVEYVLRVLIVQKFILLPLAKTRITPNQVTFMGFIAALLSCYFVFMHHNVIAGFLFFAYSILDHTDGILARYKGLTSKFGAYLDSCVDRIVFNGIFISIYFAYDADLVAVLLALFGMNFHWIVCPMYIVPNLRKLTKVRRFGLKKWFMDRGWILGIDVAMLAFMIGFGLIFGLYNELLYLVGALFLFDVIYRYIELKVNFAIEKAEK